MARLINRIAGRKGQVFGDRYHAHVLATPRQVRNALAYVLFPEAGLAETGLRDVPRRPKGAVMANNAKKHAAERGRPRSAGWIDPCSTARLFFVEGGRGLRAARTWLLRVGWQRWGPITPRLMPAAG